MRETNDGFRSPRRICGCAALARFSARASRARKRSASPTPELVAELASTAQSDALLLLDRDGGLKGERGQAARICLYLFERDQAVGLIRSG